MKTTDKSADALTAQEALAAIDTFEIVGENNDSREPNDDDRFLLHEFIAHAFGSFPVTQPSKDASRAWEYSFIHSSVTDRGDTKIGPCLTYDRSIAFGVGCIEQRKVFVSATGVDQHEAAPADRRHVGDSNFEGWYSDYAAKGETNPKQIARDSYAAGMGDDTPQPEPPAADERAAFDASAIWHKARNAWMATSRHGTQEDADAAAIAVLNAARASSPNAAGVEGAPRYTEWLHLRAHGAWSNGVPEWARDYSGRMNDFTAASAVIEELAALARAPRTDVAGGVPDGWKLMPVDPTIEMLTFVYDPGADDTPSERYAALLAAAPQPPSADAAAAPADAQAVEGIRAWETDDGRVISDGQKQQALRDGGASASSVRPFSIALGRIATAQAVEAVATPFGWAQPKGGNYFTRSEVTAKRIGGLVPVYAAPPPPAPASAPVGLTDEQRKAIEWAIGMASQHNIHHSPLRALLKGDKHV